MKNREFDKKAPQNFYSEQVTIAERQGTSENELEDKLQGCLAKTLFSSTLYTERDSKIGFRLTRKLSRFNDRKSLKYQEYGGDLRSPKPRGL